MKYINAPRNLLSGIDNKQIARSTLIAIPLRPYPSIIAPMYLGGSMPPRAKVVDWTIPPNIPNTTRIDIHAANAAPSFNALVINGSANMRTAIAI